MNKGQGAAVGAVLLAGAMFRGGFTPGPKPQDAARPQTTATAASKLVREGPWLASCKYWAATRWVQPADERASPGLQPATKPTNSEADAPATASAEDPATACERTGDGWGIPPPKRDHEPDIRTIIATVPDPIHSHFALEFDRTIDALMQAAGDQQYLGSQYWLPWKSHVAPGAREEASTEEADKDDSPTRERQPGLIILKYGPKSGESDAAYSSFHRVIYLFLVGETPALGINGTQLRNALRYEAMLQKNHGARLSLSDENHLAIIGPVFSGSAASLREGIENAKFDPQPSEVNVTGETSTGIANVELNGPLDDGRKLTYLSFAENSSFELTQFLKSLKQSSYDGRRIAVLAEDGTVFGDENKDKEKETDQVKQFDWTIIRFPREISLLRNAQTDQSSKSSSQSAAPTPYLNLTLKDSDADDTVPHFSAAQTPLSQESQLMAIARQLQRDRTQFVIIAGSNILDELFLEEFLHRACPDARMVFYNGGDLLIERDVDNVPFIGSILVSPYNLIDLDNSGGSSRAFSDSHSQRAYNAASHVFWQGTAAWKNNLPPQLAGYHHGPDDRMRIPLWAIAAGSDGYYPLGILSSCASDSASILPSFAGREVKTCVESDAPSTPRLIPKTPNSAPSLLWFFLCILITCVCTVHAVVMCSAEYWSPFTRDVAVRQNDQPRRRSVYINIGTSMLFSMAFVIAFPLFSAHRFYHNDIGSVTIASLTLLSGIAALAVTLAITLPYIKPATGRSAESAANLYPYFDIIAIATAFAVPAIWAFICLQATVGDTTPYVGLFFSYRCLHPDSGLSPVVPILLLLFGWFLWATFQTARLRFSPISRPRLPGPVPSGGSYPLFVSDCDLSLCETPIHSCLFENITCLLITREIVRRFTRWRPSKLNAIFFLIYLGLFTICIACGHIQSLERFLLHPPRYLPTPYEFLIAALFFPLIMIALTGWLRMIFVWGSLSRGLLEPLERMPIRFAFTRLREVGWMTMISQSSLHIRWRDMARSIESIRQLVNTPELKKAVANPADWKQLTNTYDDLMAQIVELRKRIGFRPNDPVAPPYESNQNRHPVPHTIDVVEKAKETLPDDDDLPMGDHCHDLLFIRCIEVRYAEFCKLLLSSVLIPYWNERRYGFVEDHGDSPDSDNSKIKPDEDPSKGPLYIHLAEELLAIRYVALIRSVLVNIRFLAMFVSAAFVLGIIAWNSYPFQPHQLIDWCFTVLLVFLGTGFIWVFAQMHRNAILSRITDTKPNELGIDFYLRVATFGAIPVLTWFAYQFPQLGGSLFRILQPGLQVMK